MISDGEYRSGAHTGLSVNLRYNISTSDGATTALNRLLLNGGVVPHGEDRFCEPERGFLAERCGFDTQANNLKLEAWPL